MWNPFEELACPEDWDRLKPGRSLQFAGTDPGGANVDSGNFVRIEPEGASFQEGDWVLAEMEGPGVITRIWVTGKDKNNKGPRIFGRIQIYVDSKDKPVVDLPIEEFFGKTEPFIPPLATPTSGGWISYVPIPFSSYCKVVVMDHKDQFAHRVNGLKQTIPHLYHHVDWRKLPEGTEVEPFSLPLSLDAKDLLRRAAHNFDVKQSAEEMDSFDIAPGEKKEVFSLQTCEKIEELRFSSKDADKLWLNIYWDGKSEPAVDVPARDFFAAGLEPQPFNALPFSFDGKIYSCRFPMPFTNGVKIFFENRSGNTTHTLFKVKISPQSQIRNPQSTLCFHAHYIEEDLAAGSPDLVVLSTSNGPGQFVGCALTLPHDFMEGNESFIVDGEKEPGWVGTGTEDYFSGGWYFCFGPYAHAFSGCTHKGDYVSAYRFHLLDAITYEKSLMMKLEHGAANESAGLARGVAYWYQRD